MNNVVALRHVALIATLTLSAAWSPLRAQASPDDAACQPPAAPTSVLASELTLAGPRVPGERLHAVVRFVATSGEPLRNVLVYAYHANASGAYVPDAAAVGCLRFHGALHGWARPDANGVVTLHTIRPGAYPRSTEPAHIHVVVQFPGKRGFYLNDVMFDDDPRLSPSVRAAQQAPGGPGVVKATRDQRGEWHVSRVVTLQPPTR